MSTRPTPNRGTQGTRLARPGLRAPVALVLAVCVALSLMPPALAADDTDGDDAGDANIEPQLRDELAGGATTDFWVYLDEEAELSAAASMKDRDEQGRFVHERLTATASRSQRPLLELLDDEGVDHEAFWLANTVRVTGDEDLVERIAARPEVAHIAADRTYELPEPIPAAEVAQVDDVEWGVHAIGAHEVWDTFEATGEGIVVGVIDSGAMYHHAALVGQYRGTLGGDDFDHHYSWHDPSNVCGSPSVQPCDNSGHGTHVTGTIVGGDGGDNHIGVAPGARWIAAKGCESNTCSQSALLSSGQFMLAPTDLDGLNPRPDLRPHVVNNSWGGGATTDPWYRQTVEAWVAAGIFPQFANGNWSQGTAPCGTSANPGNLPESYAAGAFDVNGSIAAFSRRGPSAWGGDVIKPDIAAPGVAVRSAWIDGGYRSASGTSMASPHVAGVVALIWSAALQIERDVDATRDLLGVTAADVEDLTCGGTAGKNNVWGEGRLDAFAAVDAAPRGPVGVVEGVVLDVATGEPIAGATVTASGDAERIEITGPDGAYRFRLLAGEYDITATAFGYLAETAEVTVVADETITANLALAPADSITVSGRITDGNDHGWPLYARIEVEGTPMTAHSDPVTGDYSLRLPAGSTYTLSVAPEYPGYGTATETVEATEGGDVTIDVALEVDQCHAAPGYEFSGNIAVLDSTQDRFAPYLEDQGIPVTPLRWGDDPSSFDVVIVNIPGFPTGNQPILDFLDATDAAGVPVLFLDSFTNGGGVWLLRSAIQNPADRSNGFSSAIPYTYFEVVEEHPILEGFEVGQEIVFDNTSRRKEFSWFDRYLGDGRTVIANAGRADTGILGPSIGYQERDTNRHVLLSMHGAGVFHGPQFWTDEAEQIFFNSLQWLVPDATFECLQVDGGLVLGQVTDLNTGAGINGAAVSGGAADEPATSYRTPHDPALDDGFYWTFAPNGSQQLTAAADRYVEVADTVDVAASAVTALDFALPAGRLAVDTGALHAEVELGDAAERTFEVTNTGTAPAGVDLEELRGSFELLGSSRTSGGEDREVETVEGEVSFAARPTDGAPATAAPDASDDPRPAADPWIDLANHPTSIMDNTVEELDGRLYAFGGYTGTTVLASAHVYNPRAGVWSPIASLPAPRQKAEAVAIGDKIYVFGGWDRDWEPTATTLIYDTTTDSWSHGADMPAARAAAGVTSLDGLVYVVGGCTTTGCTPMANSVFRYDPDADEWETLPRYPTVAAWLGCGGMDGRVVCVGGNTGEGELRATFAFDPATDTWTRKADLPYNNWAMAYGTAAGQLVITGGIAFGAVTNASAAYQPGADLWVPIAPANVPVYRGAAACGFYRVGGSLTGFTPVSHAERHPDYDDCLTDVGLDWLTVDPPDTVLQPGETVTITAAFDGDVDQPGTFSAGIRVGHDTPYEVAPVGITMEVTPPRHWVRLSGQITSIGCGGTTSPLAGVTIQIEGRLDDVELWTGHDDHYARWLSTKNQQLTMVVSANGHLSEVRETRLHPKHPNVEDFALRLICGSASRTGPR